MSSALILHIPHSSVRIPKSEGYLIEEESLQREILKLTDWYTDDLFSLESSVVVKSEFSRIFCDVERFADDKQEVMAKYGMGVLYERCDNGSILRKVNPDLREEILNQYYWPHHNKLNQAVENQLEFYGQAVIIDCHSFPSKPLIRDLSQNADRPDFNIGTDPFHTAKELITASKDFFHEKGYSLGVDWPYAGSVVPMAHYHKTKEVVSIMLEINRSLYLVEPSNKKSDNYDVIKRIVKEYLIYMKNLI